MKTTNARSIALVSLISVISASPLGDIKPRVDCHDVHIFTSRGTGQQIPDNLDNELVPGVCDGLSSCGYEDVQYPAAYAGTSQYCPDSEILGANAALSQLQAYADACPGTKVVLAGYSQGAEIVGDLLSGNGGNGCQPGYGPLDPNSAASKMIAAVVIFGDPSRTPGQSYNVGTAGDVAGDFYRDQAQLDALNVYADRMQSYCNSNDSVCAAGSGGTDGGVHGSEVENNVGDAITWVKNHI